VAALLAVPAAARNASAIGRLRREQQLGTLHAAAVAALERAREVLGEIRAGMAGPGTTVAQLLVLIDAAAAMAGSAISLCELRAESGISAPLAKACQPLARLPCRTRRSGRAFLGWQSLASNLGAAPEGRPIPVT